MRRASHFHRWPGRHTGLWRLALLGLCFCGGILLGQLAARSVPEASRTELAAYLRQYAAVWGETTDRTASLLRVAGVYLRYPLLVTVLGFCGAAGAALILPVLAAEGFFLSFSAGCFAAALGRSGVLLALAAFGVRCLIVLPCSIYPAMLVGERNRWRKLAVCGALLLLGMALELTLQRKRKPHAQEFQIAAYGFQHLGKLIDLQLQLILRNVLEVSGDEPEKIQI